MEELDQQVSTLRDCGITPTHFDGHQNKHLFPPFFVAAARVAKQWGIHWVRSHKRYLLLPAGSRARHLLTYYAHHPSRLATHTAARVITQTANWSGLRSADRLITPGYADYGDKAMLETWLRILKEAPPGTNEVYCHPGYPDAQLAKTSYYVEQRESEVRVLTSKKLRNMVQASGIRLVSFKDLDRHAL